MGRFARIMVRWVARAARVSWFRSVEVSGAQRLALPGPMLMVANHAGGFVDPTVIVSIAPRTPRFLAMGSLFRGPLGPLLRFAGAIPVHRAVDGSTGANVASFDACHEVLAGGGVVGIFPEGRASDAPHLLPVRTGAARIALGARRRGARGLLIVPIGLIYEDKGSARARALVRVGEPIDLDAEVPAAGLADDEDPATVRPLTALIERRLASVALDYEDAAEAADLFFAAQVALRRTGGNPAWSPPLSSLEAVAGRLARADAATRTAVREAAVGYRAALAAIDGKDAVVASGQRPHLHAGRVLAGAFTVAAVPLAVVGTIANLMPALAVHLAGRRSAPPVTLATVKFLVGFVLFPIDWLLLRSFAFDATMHPWLWTVLAGPGCGLLAVVVGDRLRRIRLARMRPARMLLPSRAADDLAERRAWLVEQVAAALETAGQGPEGAGSLGN